MRNSLLRLTALLPFAALLVSATAWAQDAPVPAEDESFPPAWFRIDSDGSGLQLWAGATHALTDGVGLATDMYVNSGTLGEFDIGPAIAAGPFTATPMLGIQFDWGAKKAAAIVPQFYLVGGPDPIYMELWVQSYLYEIFDYPTELEAANSLYLRLFVDYKLSPYVAIGPQVEATFALSGDGDTLTSLPIGGSVMLSNYGANNALFAFLGYETQEAPPDGNDNRLVGRLSFVRNF